ncbi:MAG: hypothetical protein ABIN20_00145 [candidate division WOR-3 bacterium]
MEIKPVYLMQPIPYFGEKLDYQNFICEPKIDGWRMQVLRYLNGKIEFWGRRLEKNPNWTFRLNYLIEIAEKFLPPGTILDSELYDERGRRFIPSLFTKKGGKPLIYVFDILFYKGEKVYDKELMERKKVLESIDFLPPFKLIEYKKIICKDDIFKYLKEAKEKGNEGIILKHIKSKYIILEEGPSSTEFWIKIK